MAKLLEVYKCNLCGNIVEIVHAGDGASCPAAAKKWLC